MHDADAVIEQHDEIDAPKALPGFLQQIEVALFVFGQQRDETP